MSRLSTLLLLRLSGLLRTRVVMSCVGLWVMHEQPCISQWIVAVVGLSLGISAIEAWKGTSGIRISSHVDHKDGGHTQDRTEISP